MGETLPGAMTADDFLAWSERHPGRYELVDGTVVAMAPERFTHADLKGEIYARLREAIRAGGLGCRAIVDGMGVQVDRTTVYEPDVIVRCGAPLDGDPILVPDPMVIVEILSPSTQSVDLGVKLEGYFRVESVRHYVIVDGRRRAIIHHERHEDGLIVTRISRDGTLRLDPPGIALADLFAPS